ncbi:type III secretion system export apparatus subunit SctR [Herbaspirillum sp. ST 5-3]|uniref:type III secretion system export apparatus subunit SctR n=1 Tax=Oxalobacteraceae TaxID=75682 RepID=UPI0010A599C7|nr:type III secretion system export apparatus subunit SctR [Herbaspirillum sp. ST 5-3]
MKAVDPISLTLLLALLGLLPLFLVVTTSFLKISTVIILVRNALGVQQVPPNIALYGLSIILSLYIMTPVVNQVSDALRDEPGGVSSVASIIHVSSIGAEPIRSFLFKHSKPEQRAFFINTGKRMWPEEQAKQVKETDFLVLMPSFVIGELTAAFEVGFLLYLPFMIIDLIVSNILLALGMMMVSPSTISLPLKLFLFVMVDGWTRLLQGLILSYI